MGRSSGYGLLMEHKTAQSSVVAQGYGTGYSLTVLKEAAERINAVEDGGYLDVLRTELRHPSHQPSHSETQRFSSS